MFMGEYEHTLDAKGRVMLPVKFREELGPSFIICRGLEGCLSVYPRPAWLKLAQAIKKLHTSKGKVRAFKRFVFGSAAEVEFDRQGRVLIPPALRKYAGLTKEVTILGTGDKAEIWNRAAYAAYSEKTLSAMEDIAESLDASLDLDF